MEEKRCRAWETKEESSKLAPFFKCAELTLPWLNPSELASISSTCKTLHRISKSVTLRRASDASRSLETSRIPFINTLDDRPYAFFLYTPSQIITPSDYVLQSQSWGGSRCDPDAAKSGLGEGPILVSAMGENASRCDCERCDEVEEGLFRCPCSSLRASEMIMECGPSCQCRSECGNRLTQNGISVRLKIVRDSRKGWGLHADQLILRGQFICEYAGELLTTCEARRRQKIYDEISSGGGCCSALLVVREHLPSGRACMRINIDATRIGNVARFINHSCDGGNLSTEVVRQSGVLLPRLCFFATRDIQENEELTFSYGVDRLRQKGLPCFCGSLSCFGILPSEHT